MVCAIIIKTTRNTRHVHYGTQVQIKKRLYRDRMESIGMCERVYDLFVCVSVRACVCLHNFLMTCALTTDFVYTNSFHFGCFGERGGK